MGTLVTQSSHQNEVFFDLLSFKLCTNFFLGGLFFLSCLTICGMSSLDLMPGIFKVKACSSENPLAVNQYTNIAYNQ